VLRLAAGVVHSQPFDVSLVNTEACRHVVCRLYSLAAQAATLARALFQLRGGVLKTLRKGFVGVANFADESVHDNLKGSRYLLGFKTPDQGAIEPGRNLGGQPIRTATVIGGQSMANARERQRVTAYAGYHVFRLPQPAARDATPRVKRVQPSKADQVACRRRGKGPGLMSRTENEPEGRSERSELSGRYEREVHLKGSGKEKHAVKPRPTGYVQMMNRRVLRIHVRGPLI
jgi:hypothetical protein